MPAEQITTVLIPPNKATDLTPEAFDDKADAFAGALPTWTGEANDVATWINTTAIEVEADRAAAAVSETNAASSATASANSANFKGAWSSLTGALNKPATVLHQGAFWALLNNLADVTASQPSVTGDWAFANGTRWRTPYTASATLAANSQNTVKATSAAADFTLPTFATNDFVVLHNSPDTTQTVRILNSSYTIRGKIGTVTAGDNLLLLAGDTVHLVAISASILEIV